MSTKDFDYESTEIDENIYSRIIICEIWSHQNVCKSLVEINSGAPVAFKTWCGHQYRVGIICPPLVEIGLRWLPKLGVDTSPRPHVHMRTCNFRFEIKSTGNRQMSNALVPWQWAILHNWLNEYIPGRTRDIQMKCLDTYILFILYIILESNHFCLRKTNRKNSS